MKSSFPLALSILLFVSLLYACDKDDGVDTSTPSKVLYLKMDSARGYYSEYVYDTQNRLVKWIQQGSDTTIFYYSNNNRLDSFVTQKNSKILNKQFYSYNSSNQLVKTVLYSDNENGPGIVLFEKKMYTYLAGQIRYIETHRLLYGTMLPFTKIYPVYKNGNLYGEEVLLYNADSAKFVLTYHRKYTYDSKNNPYFVTMKKIGYFGFMNNSRNNLIKQVVTDKNGVVDKKLSANFSYQYNNDNYPVEQKSSTSNGVSHPVNIYRY